VVQGFGFSELNTLLLQIPSAVWGVSLVLIGSVITSKVSQVRMAVVTLYLILSFIGALMIRQLPTEMKVARLIGIYLFASTAATFPFMMSMIASNVAGYTKKTTVNAIFFIGYCIGNISGPQTFKSSEAPNYPSAFSTMIVCMALAIVSVVALAVILIVANKRREYKYPSGLLVLANGDVQTREVLGNGSDLTDWEQEETFRYRY
jgi:ACS family allantoate permease-like MFS transporter